MTPRDPIAQLRSEAGRRRRSGFHLEKFHLIVYLVVLLGLMLIVWAKLSY